MIDRAARVEELAAATTWHKPRQYVVPGTETPHLVTLGDQPSCDCADFVYRGQQRPCVHVAAARRYCELRAPLAAEGAAHALAFVAEGGTGDELADTLAAETEATYERIETKLHRMEARLRPDPQAALIDAMSDDEALDALGPSWAEMSETERAACGGEQLPTSEEAKPVDDTASASVMTRYRNALVQVAREKAGRRG